MAKQGAFFLLIGFSLLAQPLPPVVFPHYHYVTNTYHFSGTTYGTNIQSPFGPEYVWTDIVTNGRTFPVTLGWQLSTDPLATGYRIYGGTYATRYDTNWDAGNTNEITVNPYPPPPPLNHYLKVTWTGTIWGSYDLSRPWMLLSYPTNTFTLTNPSGAHVYWKATNITLVEWASPQ